MTRAEYEVELVKLRALVAQTQLEVPGLNVSVTGMPVHDPRYKR